MNPKKDGAKPHRRPTPRGRYDKIRRIDGRHPLMRAAPDCFVPYPARRRHDAEVAYFNFGLAREMGLIPRSHPDRLTAELRRTLIETFGLVIINEYDYLNRTPIPAQDVLPHRYMATRYLQLQHPDKRGDSSGDGRSVWNGHVRHAGVTWDVSSCGIGVTRLCPATSEQGRFFRTGNYIASYGCGTAALAEGINAAVMSEVFHRNEVQTERVLAVLALPSGLAINVRAARNLLRPSHFFVHLHQRNLEMLRSTVDFFIDRQIANGEWPRLPEATTPARARRRYRHFARDAARTFARITATYESEYVFCWLDWDGDNILADGGIIDYGSVRQFGLYHREYRFEDVDRMSTTIPEQRRKARHVVQKYAQIRDYLISGEKKPLARFANDSVVRLFDREFERHKRELLLRKAGFAPRDVTKLGRTNGAAVRRFQRAFATLERARSARGRVNVSDGLTWDAIYCMRDVLRELPVRYAEACRSHDGEPDLAALLLDAPEFFAIAHSSFASRKDRRPSTGRRRQARELQRSYLALMTAAAGRGPGRLARKLQNIAARSATLNRYDRITGDSVDHVSNRLIRARRRLGPDALYRLIQRFTDYQDLIPEHESARLEDGAPALPEAAERVFARMVALAGEYREGL